MSVCWGILPTARINDKVLAGAKASEAVAMIAVASRDATRAESHARKDRVERAYASYAALLEKPFSRRPDEVERVYIEALYRSADASTPGLLAERSSA